MQDLLRPAEVARRLGISRTWLYDAAKHGRIPSIRIGGPHGPVRFVEEDVDRWLDEARSAWRPGDTTAETGSGGGDPRAHTTQRDSGEEALQRLGLDWLTTQPRGDDDRLRSDEFAWRRE